MERGALKGHGALLLANVIWGLNSPICKTVLLAREPGGAQPFRPDGLSSGRGLFCSSGWHPPSSCANGSPGATWADCSSPSLFRHPARPDFSLWGLSLHLADQCLDHRHHGTHPHDDPGDVLSARTDHPASRRAACCSGAAGSRAADSHQQPRVKAAADRSQATSSPLVSSVCYAIYLTARRKVILKYSPVTTMKWMFFAAIVVVVFYHRPALEVDFRPFPHGSGAEPPSPSYSRRSGLSDGADRPALPASDGYQHVHSACNPSPRCFSRSCARAHVFGFTKAAAAGCIFLGVWLVTMSKSRKRPRRGTSRQNDG